MPTSRVVVVVVLVLVAVLGQFAPRTVIGVAFVVVARLAYSHLGGGSGKDTRLSPHPSLKRCRICSI